MKLTVKNFDINVSTIDQDDVLRMSGKEKGTFLNIISLYRKLNGLVMSRCHWKNKYRRLYVDYRQRGKTIDKLQKQVRALKDQIPPLVEVTIENGQISEMKDMEHTAVAES